MTVFFASQHHSCCCRSSVLCARPDGRVPLPAWVVRWAALVLAFINREHAQLPGLLTGTPLALSVWALVDL